MKNKVMTKKDVFEDVKLKMVMKIYRIEALREESLHKPVYAKSTKIGFGA